MIPNSDRPRFIAEIATEVVSQIRDSIKIDDKDSDPDLDKAILATLKVRYINVTGVVDVDVRSLTKALIQDKNSNKSYPLYPRSCTF